MKRSLSKAFRFVGGGGGGDDNDDNNTSTVSVKKEETVTTNNLNEDDADDVLGIFRLPRKKARHQRVKREKKIEIQVTSNPRKKTTRIIDDRYHGNDNIILTTDNDKRCNNNNNNNNNNNKDIEYEYVNHLHELEGKKENAIVTAFLSMNILLNAHTVYSKTFYWISQYVNYEIRNEVHWFTDHIRKILQNPIDFNLTSSKGVSDFYSKEIKHNILIHTIGSDLHKFPIEYFIVQSNETLLRCIRYLMELENGCFLINRPNGLKGELECYAFVYNKVMNFFYEPSFFIITSYLIYCCNLFYNSGGRDITDYIDILDEIIEPLKLEFPIECLLKENTNYSEKRTVLLDDIRRLYEIFLNNKHDTEAIRQGIEDLWSEKASYCSTISVVRFLNIYKQLYG